MYQFRRYDFDDSLAEGLELHRAGPLGAAFLISRSPIAVLEINEPLMLESLSATGPTLLLLALSRLIGRGRVTIVSYAIGNTDPFHQYVRPRLRSRLRKRAERVLAAYVWRRLDRIAFGTSAARDVYEAVLGPARAKTRATTIPALPAPAAEVPDVTPDPLGVVFVGALTERKGFSLLLDAWPAVTAANPGARLQVIGKGPLEREAAEAAERDASITVLIDPPRDDIHRAMAGSQVLVLPSQPSPTWREQVGLPIVEGLSHGCSIVTTAETGLADWLAEHGHSVIPSTATSAELAAAILEQLATSRPRSEVLSTLPARDGRLAGDDWLFAGRSRR